MTFEELETNITRWATERGIIEHSTAQAQFLKAVAEMGELADGLAKGRRSEVIDGVGDVMVCLINMCCIMKIHPVYCLAAAWNEIKDRKGRMIEGGVFVREDDAPKA